MLSEVKGKKLNNTEISIINCIYAELYPLDIESCQIRYKIIICPHCFTTRMLTENLWECDCLICKQCGNEFKNPLIQEKENLKMQKLYFTGVAINEFGSLIRSILLAVLMFFIISGIIGLII